jgi:ATP-dependent Clp protease adaptor protein ClpS
MTTEIIVDKKTKTTNRIKEPGKFKVIVCNDDSTPIEFVVSMLMAVFRHNEKIAMGLTLQIHTQGSAVAGIYNFEVAEQKAIDGTNLARGHGWPLIIKVEPE